jgi:hypothetical protein
LAQGRIRLNCGINSKFYWHVGPCLD